jgi:hypothetical protein
MASGYQRAKRLAFWRFYLSGFAVFTLLAVLSGLAGRVTG